MRGSGRSLTRLLGFVTATTLLLWIPQVRGADPAWAFYDPIPGTVAASYTSFFTDLELVGAGWSACAGPVTWSIDVRGLTARAARAEIRRLKGAWSQWGEAAGLTFRFAGRQDLVFDPATNNLRAADGSPQPARHVYLAMKSPTQVSIMRQTTVGLAMPSLVLLPTRAIVSGMAIFRRGYVKEQRRTSTLRLTRLYLHEMGHVLGLGHSGSTSNVMFAEMDTIARLGPGDKAGVADFTQPCAPTSLPSLESRGWSGYWPIQPEMGSEAK